MKSIIFSSELRAQVFNAPNNCVNVVWYMRTANRWHKMEMELWDRESFIEEYGVAI